MMKFLRKIFGPGEDRPTLGESRFTWWQNPLTKNYHWHLQDGNNQIIAAGEPNGYSSSDACLDAIANVADEAGSASVVERELA